MAFLAPPTKKNAVCLSGEGAYNWIYGGSVLTEAMAGDTSEYMRIALQNSRIRHPPSKTLVGHAHSFSDCANPIPSWGNLSKDACF